jgi:hypothetical protein
VKDLKNQVEIDPQRFVVSHGPVLAVDVVHLVGKAKEMGTGGDGTGKGVLRECELRLEVVPLTAEVTVTHFQDGGLVLVGSLHLQLRRANAVVHITLNSLRGEPFFLPSAGDPEISVSRRLELVLGDKLYVLLVALLPLVERMLEEKSGVTLRSLVFGVQSNIDERRKGVDFRKVGGRHIRRWPYERRADENGDRRPAGSRYLLQAWSHPCQLPLDVVELLLQHVH